MNADPITFRQKIHYYLEEDRSIIAIALDALILGLIFLFSVSFVLETYPLSNQWHLWFRWSDRLILGFFSLEYSLRLWSADNRIRYIFSLYSLLDLLAIAPSWLGIIDSRFVRLLRWFRVLRLVRFLERDQRLIPSIPANGILFVRTLFTIFAIVFIYSGFIYQVEHAANSSQFRTFLDSFYFSAVTMTTVGFGDIAPISEAGRLLTVLMIFTGVALIPWQLGELLRNLLAPKPQENSPTILANKNCPSCRLETHDLDALFCKRCGAQLEAQVQLGGLQSGNHNQR